LPEPLLGALARALEPQPEQRTIGAVELAEVVRAHIDVAAGWLELGALLEQWKKALERSVRRAPSSGGLPRGSSESREGHAGHTLRYEEVALAFDDEPAFDDPTFEAHALPSDPMALAAVPVADFGEESAAAGGGEPALAAPSPTSENHAAAKDDLSVSRPSWPSWPLPPAARVDPVRRSVAPAAASSSPSRKPASLTVAEGRQWAPALALAAFVAAGILAVLLVILATLAK
jgi:hypothetical protein